MVRVTTCSRHCLHILVLFLNWCFTDMWSSWCQHRSPGGFKCKIFSWVSSVMCWWCQVYSFHKFRRRFDLCVVSFPVHVVQQFFNMIYLQPDCSIPPLWRCLPHLFHLLQEFLQLYLQFLLSVIFNPRCWHVHVTLTKPLPVLHLFEKKWWCRY